MIFSCINNNPIDWNKKKTFSFFISFSFHFEFLTFVLPDRPVYSHYNVVAQEIIYTVYRIVLC